jgi:hypothetical protein
MNPVTHRKRCMECGRTWTLTFNYCPMDAGWLVVEAKPAVPIGDVPYMHMKKGLKVITPEHGIREVRETDPKGTFYFFDENEVLRIVWYAGSWTVMPRGEAPDPANVHVIHAFTRSPNLGECL